MKALAGNPGRRELPEGEPQFAAESGHAPRWLSAEAKAEWRRVMPELRAMGLLTVVDRAALEAYCEHYATWVQAREALRTGGLTYETETGYVRPRPEVQIANDAAKLVLRFMSEFGMTPSSRSRVSTPPGETEADPFAAFLADDHMAAQLEELEQTDG